MSYVKSLFVIGQNDQILAIPYGFVGHISSSLYLICNKDLINISRIALHVPGTEAFISSLNSLLFVHFAVFICS